MQEHAPVAQIGAMDPLASLTTTELDYDPAGDPAGDPLCRLIRRIRHRTRLTQHGFARRYGIPLGTLRDWEQGRAKPDSTARSYLALIGKAPEEIAALIGD